MNFMGMGLAEIAVVLVVAFLVLGPNRTINLARTAGKLLADLRRTFSEVAAAVSLEEKGQAASSSSPWESRPVAQPQPSQEGSAPEESVPQDLVPEDLVPEDLGSKDPSGPAPAPAKPDPTKNGDE